MRKQRIDSLSGRIAAAQPRNQVYSVPEYLEPLSEAEEASWRAHTAAREQWRDTDLHALHLLVKLESQLRDLRERLANADDDNFVRLSAMEDKKVRQLQAQRRSVGLNLQASTGRDVSMSATKARAESAGSGAPLATWSGGEIR